MQSNEYANMLAAWAAAATDRKTVRKNIAIRPVTADILAALAREDDRAEQAVMERLIIEEVKRRAGNG